jgi:hypothetical protein
VRTPTHTIEWGEEKGGRKKRSWEGREEGSEEKRRRAGMEGRGKGGHWE